ncbi:chloride channel protein [Sphingopyxis sp.]|uniref:chloride channel protein n=1 Tax=Sphingopyxis sp. TaxID=1908224 RepID=UPI00258620ED|nr:chloride channel protein [Sphingopyxis sp.]
MALVSKAAILIQLTRLRRKLRASEAAFVALTALAGLVAGLLTVGQQLIAHGIQRLFYGVSINRLSALGSIHHPWKLAALPIGGLLMVLLVRWLRRRRAPIDVVEANALHGGRIPFADNLVISAQTILSNGVGASVGLEAAYAQMGGGFASILGQWFALRRNDLRTLVGAGAGAAIGAAFGAPLTGAFYAFEIVIGTYSPAAVAPVMAAALAAASVTRLVGIDPYLIATTTGRGFSIYEYLAYAGLGLVCAAAGIAIMRLVTFVEQMVQGWKSIAPWRPIAGGLLLIPLALISPQTLSAGHGALHLDLLMHPALAFLAIVLVLKIAASVISLSFGFRGGLFFASLFLGSLLGQLFAGLVNLMDLGIELDPNDAALVGMAALSVSVVGGPMTLAILMLETTHDFALMGVVLTATLVSGTITRELFGYSFSTWRLHIRGSAIRSPRDIGWMFDLTARSVMRRDWVAIPLDMTVAEFRQLVPLGSTKKSVLTDGTGHYRGIVPTASAFRPDLDTHDGVASIAILTDTTLTPNTGIDAVLRMFDRESVDELAVVDDDGHVLGIVTEKYARRRYFEGIEMSQREIFGEV